MKLGMIYQIYYNDNPNIHYIGSSMNNEIRYRWRDHKADYKKYLDNPNNQRAVIYQYFKEFGIENFTIKKIKDLNIIDRDHLKAYEQLYINKLKPVNKLNPFNILAKEDKKNYRKNYYIKNKEKIQLKEKNRYKNNKEYFDNYKEENKEKIKEYKKKYYEKQRDNNTEQYQKLVERANKIIKCEICNIETTQRHMKKHLETKKHQDNEKGIKIDHSNDLTKKLCDICNCYISKKHFNEHLNSKKHLENSK